MRHSVRRLVYGAGAVAAVGALTCGQGIVGAASASSADAASPTTTASKATSAKMVSARIVSSRTAAAAAYVPPRHPLLVGAHGPAVRSVQQRLANLKYYPGPIDGKYGPDLQEAAWAFREVQGLPMNASRAAQPITRTFEHDLINPRLPHAKFPKRAANRIEINQNIQVLVLYKDSKPTLIIHVSTGGGYHYCSKSGCGVAITPDGHYKALSFAAGWIKVPLGTMYNPVFFIGRAYAIHGDIPVPWYPASHGCVRIWMDVAPWFHKRISIGGAHPTPVYVYGTAPYQPSIVGT
ncbi:MAG TPA: L,D-transpeptidase family protein [Streptosporangiaceae bacterium]|nr:L,D-transpeptidase family protein [Streptosporangiaceae bacterium]